MQKVFKQGTDPEKVADIILALMRTQAQFYDNTLSEDYKKKLEKHNKEYWEQFYKMTEWR